MKTFFISFFATALCGFALTNELLGRWQSKPSPNGNVTGVVFRNDSSFEGFVNKKPFVSGTYSYTPKDSVFTFTDNGCKGMKGIYKIVFFSNSDSLRFLAISDSCSVRKNGMEKLILGRVKKGIEP
jgi:hypothetical protein